MAKRWGGFSFIFVLVCLIVPSSVQSELYFSIFSGPSTSLRQDLKYREYNNNQRLINRQVVSSDTYLRFKAGSKISYFFSKNFGVETEYFFGHMLAGIDTTNDGQIDTLLKQDRHAFLLSLIYRQTISKRMKTSFYGGMGAGGVYSDFESIGNSWDYGGQFIWGFNYSMSERHLLFLEMAYFWAPDVIDKSTSPGKHYKTSGNNEWNLANHLFGPHYDTQVIALLVGTRFRISK